MAGLVVVTPWLPNPEAGAEQERLAESRAVLRRRVRAVCPGVAVCCSPAVSRPPGTPWCLSQWLQAPGGRDRASTRVCDVCVCVRTC